MPSRLYYDPLTAVDPLGFPVDPPDKRSEYDAYIAKLAQEISNLRAENQEVGSSTEPEQPLYEAMANAAAGSAVKGAGNTLRAAAVFNTTLPWVEPLYDRIFRFPQMDAAEQKAFQRWIVGPESDLTHDMKARLLQALTKSARTGQPATLAELGANDPDQSRLMAASRSMTDWANQAFPVSEQNQNRFLVRGASLFGSALGAAPGLALGPLGYAGVIGLQSAGQEDADAQAGGADLAQRIEAAGKKGALDAVTSLLPLQKLVAPPFRPTAEGWGPWIINKAANAGRVAGTAAPLGELEHYATSKIHQDYDPTSEYEFDWRRPLGTAAITGLLGAGTPSPRLFTPEQEAMRKIERVADRVVQYHDFSPVDRPFIPNRVPTLQDIEARNSSIRQAERGVGIDPHDHHLFSQELRPYFEQKGIDIDKYIITLPEYLHNGWPYGVHSRGDSWNPVWSKFAKENPAATTDQIFQQLNTMLDKIPEKWARPANFPTQQTMDILRGMAQATNTSFQLDRNGVLRVWG